MDGQIPLKSEVVPVLETPERLELLRCAQRKRRLFLGFPIDALSTGETLEVIERAIQQRIPIQHVVVNVAKLISMRSDAELARDVTESDLINVDGMGVVFGCRLLGIPVKERVAGIDLMERLLAECAAKGWRPYFLGATEEVLQEAVCRLAARHPRLDIAGSHHGYFPPSDDERIATQIADARPDCLFIAISSPRKEAFMNRWRERMNIPFVMGVGGSIDVIAGKVQRAPLWMQRVGLEWLFRLVQEPGRLWRRYLFTNAAYARLLMLELLKRRVSHSA